MSKPVNPGPKEHVYGALPWPLDLWPGDTYIAPDGSRFLIVSTGNQTFPLNYEVSNAT